MISSGYYWVKETERRDWEIAELRDDGTWWTIGWDIEMYHPPFRIGPEIPQYKGDNA